MATDLGYLPRLDSREAFVDHLEGYAEPTVSELRDGKLTRKLLKTYMLETARHPAATPDLASLFPPQVQMHRLDDTWRGPTKVHVAAIDLHLWQPFLLEATSSQLTAVLPRGTCGNTIHRLVTNVQRLLDPNVDVWLGSERYETAVQDSMLAAA